MKLLALYTQLGWLVLLVLLGFILGGKLPKAVPTYLGQFLFWIGVPISILAFLRQTDISGAIWLSPIFAWLAILLGAGLAWGWISLGRGERASSLVGGSEGGARGERASPTPHKSPLEGGTQLSPLLSGEDGRGGGSEGGARGERDREGKLLITNSPVAPDHSSWSKSTQGSFLLAAMVGNTGYIGYPVTLAVVGTQYFGWALFYDLLGSTLGAYGLGVVLAAHFGEGVKTQKQLLQAILINPALWSFCLGLVFREIPLPHLAELSLRKLGWTVVSLSLVLIGMRLQKLRSWRSLPKASISLAIKMLLVPLILGSSLSLFGITGLPRLTILLQMAMPPAFATLVIAEAYNLDRDLAVTAIAIGSIGLLLTLPIWLTLFRF